MESRIVVLQRVLAQLEQDVDFITKYIHIVHEDTLHIPMKAQSQDVRETVETVEFVDTEKGDAAGMAATQTAFLGEDTVSDADLASFLSRPVRIANYTWLETASATENILSIYPWQRFFSDARIKRKLDNFAFMRANLKVKVMVNSSPFYHGFALCSYQPLQNFTPSTLATTDTVKRVQLSQRPHLWINPQDNQAGEMTLPFLWPKNWVSVKSSADFESLGALRVDAFTELASANGVTGTGVSIQIYAWAEDVVLSGSTLSLAMQSQDEYGTGPISGPASALAKVAASLEPHFGRFATATRMVANTTAGVAKLFGFTNVPVIKEARPVRVSQFANFSSPEIGFPVNKLTLDAKNELSIDPTILGLPNEDELAIKHIVTKQSYYYQFGWSTASAVDTVLAYQNVTPMCVENVVSGAVTTYGYTPSAYVAGLFQAWRGDIKVTFRFAATQYHKGRVRITYDPQGDATNNVLTVTDGSSGAYTIFADLSDSAEVSMTIPFQQALPYLTTSATTLPGKCYATSGFVFNMDSALHNGAFCVRVATALSAPIASSVVPVLVFVEGCDNLEFANPATIDPRISPFYPQSQDVVLGSEPMQLDEKRGLMNYGEVVRSLRVLMRRATPTMPFVYPEYSGAGLCRHETVNRKMPPYPGFDPGAIYTGVGKVNTAANFPYTWAAMSALQYVTLAFVGYRGSTIWHYAPSLNHDYTKSSPKMRVTRVNNSNSPIACTVYTATLSATNESRNALAALQEFGQTGMVITPVDVAAGTAVVVPNQARYLFQSTNPANATAGGTGDDSQYDAVSTVIDIVSNSVAPVTTGNVNYMDAYCGAGTDFTCIFFINTPALYKTTTVIPI